MRRRAPKMKDEGDANGYRGRTPIVDRPLLNRRHRHQSRTESATAPSTPS